MWLECHLVSDYCDVIVLPKLIYYGKGVGSYSRRLVQSRNSKVGIKLLFRRNKRNPSLKLGSDFFNIPSRWIFNSFCCFSCQSYSLLIELWRISINSYLNFYGMAHHIVFRLFIEIVSVFSMILLLLSRMLYRSTELIS